MSNVPFTLFAGGINLVTPMAVARPGTLMDAVNFVPAITGGYRRVEGYERFDGQPSPHKKAYWLLGIVITGTVVYGNYISTTTGYGKVLFVGNNELVLTDIVGTISLGQDVHIGTIGSGNLVGVAAGSPVKNGALTTPLHAEYRALAADYQRGFLVNPVPGSGPIRGVWVYRDVVYAIRDDVIATHSTMYKATATGWEAVVTPDITAGGRYEFVNYNFTAASDTLLMFGVNGKDKAFQFDGTTFTYITTGMTIDKPEHIAAHKNKLFLSFRGSVQHSGDGDPTVWSVILGAGEIGVSDQVTNMLSMIGSSSDGSLLITTTSRTYVLYGNSSADWKLSVISEETGAYARTLQPLGKAWLLDNRGVTQFGATQDYGNFAQAFVSQVIQPYMDEMRGKAVTSTAFMEDNQYRIFFDDGQALVMLIDGNKPAGFTKLLYTHAPTCYVTTDSEISVDRHFFGTADGYLMEDRVGTSHDGEPINAYFRTVFDSSGSLRVRKRYRRVIPEIVGGGLIRLQFAYDLDYGNKIISLAPITDIEAATTGGFWDSIAWEEFTWDSSVVENQDIFITGTGKNISMLFLSNSALLEPFTIQGATIEFTQRRLERG